MLIFVSLIGWGYIAARGLRVAPPGRAVAACLGMGLQCLLGSVLNALHAINVPMLLAMVGIGLGWFCWQEWKGTGDGWWELLWVGRSHRGRWVFGLVCGAVLLHLIAFIRQPIYNPWDDWQAYMVMPLKMLQLHHLPADPYSQRRVMNSLGFAYYLQDMLLTLTPLKNVSLVDGVLGILTLVSASLGIAKAFRLTYRQTLCFLLLAGLTKQLYFNLSFIWLPCGIFVAMCLATVKDDLRRGRWWVQPFCLGMMGAAATGLKNNYIVFPVLFAMAFYGLLAFTGRSPEFSDGARMGERWRFLARSLGATAAGFFGALVVWMIDLHKTSGTYFFPLLGHGFEYTTYHVLPVRSAASVGTVAMSVMAGAPLLALAAVEAKWLRWNRRSAALVSATAAAGLSTVATSLATGGDTVRRYTYPFLMVGLLLLFPLLCAGINEAEGARFAKRLKLAAVALLMVMYVSDSFTLRRGLLPPKTIAMNYTASIVAGLRNRPLNTATEVAQYGALQEALRPHATVLENVTYAYLLDNKRETYLEASLPAMASPPPAPGWPVFRDGEALGQWLTSHGVDYLIYSYGDEAMQDEKTLSKAIRDPKTTVIVRSTNVATLRAHEQYWELARIRRRVFDDGAIFALDLRQRTAGEGMK